MKVDLLPVNEEEKSAILSSSGAPRRVRLRGAVVDRAQWYEGRWPRNVPVYVDAIVSSEWAAGMRLLRRGERVLDFFDFDQGYLGSSALSEDLTPLTAEGSCLLVGREADDGQRLIRWCFGPRK